MRVSKSSYYIKPPGLVPAMAADKPRHLRLYCIECSRVEIESGLYCSTCAAFVHEGEHMPGWEEGNGP